MLTLAMPQSEPAADDEPLGLAHVQGEDRRRQALRRRRSAARCASSKVVVGEHVQDRRERLGLARCRSGPASARSPAARRRRPAAWSASTRSPPTTSSPPSAWAAGQRLAEALVGRAVDQRADQRAVGQRRADRQAWRRRLRSALDQLVGDRGVRDHPAQRGAALPGGAGGGEHDAAHGQVQIGARAPRSRRCCRRVRAAACRTGRPPAARRPCPSGSSRWPRPARPAGRRPAPGRPRRRRAPAGCSVGRRADPAGGLGRTAPGRPARSAASSPTASRPPASPQTRASAVFQDQTATGKLNAEMTPTTPSGCHCSIIRWPGPLGGDGLAEQLPGQARPPGRRCRSSPGPRRGPRR